MLKIERVQNLGMWQAYTVKREALLGREKDRARDNLSSVPAAEIERKWLFHGSDATTLGKICATGFNRSFAGRNACRFGRGVYFARDSGYSARPTYCRPDNNGEQRMLLCRVLVCSFCQGVNDANTPKERDGGILFDATVDDVGKPQIFVAYHDAQAYPEYQVTFKIEK